MKLYLGALISFLCACFQFIEKSNEISPKNSYPLQKQMNEISGLCWDNTGLYAIQDEKGVIYQWQDAKKEFSELIQFKSKGDFEGIAKVKQIFYALRSDGRIYQIDKEGEEMHFNFPMEDKDLEFEGLSYDEQTNQLLVACKHHKNKEKDQFLWIYAFNLKQNSFLTEPFLKVEKKLFSNDFNASGIGVNSKNQIVLCSAKKAALLVLSRIGEVVKYQTLDASEYSQIEGICFTADDRFYLASEKNTKEAAYLYEFN